LTLWTFDFTDFTDSTSGTSPAIQKIHVARSLNSAVLKPNDFHPRRKEACLEHQAAGQPEKLPYFGYKVF